MKFNIILLRALLSIFLFRFLQLVGIKAYNFWLVIFYKLWVTMVSYSPYGTFRRLIYYWVLWHWYIIKEYETGEKAQPYIFWWDKWQVEIKKNGGARI